MKSLLDNQIFKKTFASFMLVVIMLTTVPTVAFAALTVDIKANGLDTLALATSTDSFTISLNVLDATACEITAPVSSGFAIGSTLTINPGDSFYPSIGGSTTFTIACTDGVTSVSDSVTVSLAAVVVPPPTGGTPTTTPTIDVKINGSDSAVTLNAGETYIFTWNSTNSTACEQVSPITSGVTLNGASPVIASGNSLYPTATTSVTITVNCTDGVTSVSDSVTVSLALGTITPPTPPSGGGGGRGGRGGRASTPVITPLSCPLIKDYMRIDFQNDPIEVMKLQAFLKVFEGFDYVTINGVFDQATYDAVGAFQERYEGEILTPWGHTEATHYVYILTLKKVNEIYCQTVYNLTQDQLSEIANFRALFEQGGLTPDLPIVGTIGGSGAGPNLPPPTEIGAGDKGQIREFAAAIFAFPETLKDKMQCLYELILILFVLYILGSVVADVLYKKGIDKSYKKFAYKWTTIVFGLVIAIILAYLLLEFCLLLPLIIVLLICLLWISGYPKHDHIKSYTKKWHGIIKGKVTTIYKSKNVEPLVINLPGAREINNLDEIDLN